MSENEDRFDLQMVDLMSEVVPPEIEFGKLNPWSKPISFITWGLILTTVQLRFLYLEHILPTLGVLLIFLGFRALRHENIFFRWAWVISVIKLILHLGELFRVSSPLYAEDFPGFRVGLLMILLQILMYFLYHMALKKTYVKAGKIKNESPLIWAILWTAAIFLIAISSLSSSWLVIIPMMILYYLIIKSLSSIGDQLGDTGYFLTNAPVRISNKLFGRTYITISLAVVIISSISFNHFRLDAHVYDEPLFTTSRERLINMDFPYEALMYLSEADVEKLADARGVQVFSKTLMFDPIVVEQRDTSEGYTQITSWKDAGNKNADIKTIYIELPDNTVYVMHYFIWIEGSPYWQDGIMIDGESAVGNKELVSSSLFYRKNGIQYIAGFPRLVCEEVTIDTMLGSYNTTLISGALSYPFGSDAQGAYILHRYSVLTDTDIFTTYTNFSYLHETNPFSLPYKRAEDAIFNGGHFFNEKLQQHYADYNSAAEKEREK